MSCDRYSYQVMDFRVYFSDYNHFSRQQFPVSKDENKCFKQFSIRRVYSALSDIYLVYYFVAIIVFKQIRDIDPIVAINDTDPTSGRHFVNVSCLRHWPNVDHLRCWSNIRSTLGQVSLPPITSSVASSLHMFLLFYFFVLSLCSGSDLLYRHISVAYNPLKRNVYFTFYAANLFVDTFHSFEAGNASVIYSSKLQKKYPSVKINYLINWASIRNYFIGFRFFSDKTKVNKVPLECLLIDNLINNGFWKVSIFVNIIFFRHLKLEMA